MNQSFQVTGMSCSHCEKAVTKAVKEQDPAAQVRIDLQSGKVDVQSNLPREQLAKAIVEQGYGVAA